MEWSLSMAANPESLLECNIAGCVCSCSSDGCCRSVLNAPWLFTNNAPVSVSSASSAASTSFLSSISSSSISLWFFVGVPVIELGGVTFFFFRQQKIRSHSSLASFEKTTKTRKMNNPWREVKTTKRRWNSSSVPSANVTVTGAPFTVNTANTHEPPKRTITPNKLNIIRAVPFRFAGFFGVLILRLFRLWHRMPIRVARNMMTVKTSTRNMGPIKAPKKTYMCVMKQLGEEEEGEGGERWISVKYCWNISSFIGLLNTV